MLVYVYLLLCTITFILTQEKPSILYFSKDQVKTVGDSMDLECSVNNDQAELKVLVRKHEFIRYKSAVTLDISVGDNVKLNFETIGNYLRLNSIRKEDGGLYQCCAENGVSRHVRCTFNVHVWNIPFVEGVE
ncbi:hypothetical protein PGB90_000025 [Kerria lacca]